MIHLKGKKILVTGGGGFIGSHLIAALEARGVSKKQIFAPSIEQCDLRAKDDCARAVKGMEVVFDCAAVAGDVLLRTKIPGELFYENLVMGIYLMEAARREGVEKVITIGSASEYPEGAPVPLAEDTLWSGLPANANIPYGLSKRIVAMQGDMYRRESGMNAVHLLLTNAYGPGERYESGYMLPSLIQKILGAKSRGEKEIEVWGTGKATRDLIYVEDAVEGMLLAAEKYNEPMPLNIATGVEISIKSLVALLCSLVGFEGTVRWDTTKPEGAMRRFLDGSRAKKLIGFSPKTSLEEGLRKTIEWHTAHNHKRVD